jgi:uncharacterized membrane protein YhiD involved in acid resistance
LHHLLLAGLPAHFDSYMPKHAVGSLALLAAMTGIGFLGAGVICNESAANVHVVNESPM